MIEQAKETGKELLVATKETAVARLANPVLGPFMLSWALCNYRVFFVLFSGEPLDSRFERVDQLFSPLVDWLCGPGLALPAAISMSYILVLPWIVELVHRWNLLMKRRLREAELRSANVELLTRQESSLRVAQMRILDEKLRALEAKESIARKSGLRWQLMAISDSDSMVSEVQHTLCAFLMSGQFNFRGPRSAGPPLSRITFLDDNGAFFSNEFLEGRVKVAGWRISGLNLILEDPDNVEVGRFEFNRYRGLFEGHLADIDLQMEHSDLES